MPTATLLNNAEAQTSGTTVTTSNTGGTDADTLDEVVIGTNMTETFDSTTAAHGTNAFKFALTSTATAATYAGWSPTAWGSADAHFYGAFYFRTNSAIASSLRAMNFLNSGTAVGYLNAIAANGGFQFRDSAGTALGSASGAISQNTWYRVEFDVLTGASGAATANVYVGDSTTLQGSTTVTSATAFPNSVNNIRFGICTANFSSTSGDFVLIDSINVNNTGLPGPGPYSSSAAAPSATALRCEYPTRFGPF